MAFSWLFYGDAWGFGEFTRRHHEDALKSLRHAVKAVRKLRDAHPSVEYFVFSDTIVCIRELCPGAPNASSSGDGTFEEILVAVQFLISELVEVGLLLRGVVTFGNLLRENEVIIGEALFEAAQFEKAAVAPPLVFLPVSTLVKAKVHGLCSQSLFDNNLSRSVHVETKDGGIVRAQPLLGDKPEQLRRKLTQLLHDATVCEFPSFRSAAALKAALVMVDNVIKAGDRVR